MNAAPYRIRPPIWLAATVMALVVILGTSPWWFPFVRERLDSSLSTGGAPAPPADPHADHHHGAHEGHGHEGHSEETSLHLSAAGLKNIGFSPLMIKLDDYTRRINVPAMVVERTGRTQLQLSSPLTGVVTNIYPLEGTALNPGSPMFDIRLTHEELVEAQSNLIRTAENLEVVNREIARLESLDEGIIAGKRILEQQYEKQKLTASLRAERQALLLHGLNEEQVDSILSDRQLFQTLTVRAPAHEHESGVCGMDHPFHVQQLAVKPGQQVTAGELLGVLADHCELYIEGRAFEDDAMLLRTAIRESWSVTASLLVGDREGGRIEDLKVLYLADHVDPQSRALRFYLTLPNEIVLDQASREGHRYVEWRYKPGQRMELYVPVEKWERKIVVPAEAIVEEGAEYYVYQLNGDHFDRVAVHIEYRDQATVVVANDGALSPGDIIAARGAYQMHLALKNKAGGGVDPHAGHSH